ncbi:MAG: hypothetical protein IKM34_02725 [Clostridia bacterium]|nr:hypothetical protein [Clostridia bacterium]
MRNKDNRKKLLGLFAIMTMVLMILTACQSGDSETNDTTPLTTTKTNSDIESEIVIFDYFSEFWLEFYGTTGYGTLEMGYYTSMPSVIANNVRYMVSAEEKLENGQKITVQLSYDADLLKRSGYQLKDDSMIYTVYGLRELIPIDPFENLEVYGSGISPLCDIHLNEVDCSKAVQQYVNFGVDRSIYYANGDTIVVEAWIDEEDTIKTGYVVMQSYKEYTLSGMPRYVNSLENVDLTSLESELYDRLLAAISFSKADKLFGVYAKGPFHQKYADGIINFNYIEFSDVSFLRSQCAYFLTIKQREIEDFLSGKIGFYNQLSIIAVCRVVASDDRVQYSSNRVEGDIYLGFMLSNIVEYPDGRIIWGIESEDSQEINYSSNLVSVSSIAESSVFALGNQYNITELERKDWLDLK